MIKLSFVKSNPESHTFYEVFSVFLKPDFETRSHFLYKKMVQIMHLFIEK